MLHRFACWCVLPVARRRRTAHGRAQLPETAREGEKFVVDTEHIVHAPHRAARTSQPAKAPAEGEGAGVGAGAGALGGVFDAEET